MGADEDVSAVEVALVGFDERGAIRQWIDGALKRLLGSSLDRVDFASGRIDAVYGVLTCDGQRLLVKVHRPPVDLAGRALVAEAQRAMARAGFPCATPLAGPVDVDGRIVSLETLLTERERGDAHDPSVRASIAAGLVAHIRILATIPGFTERVGRPPAWCFYEGGAWSITHDSFFDSAARRLPTDGSKSSPDARPKAPSSCARRPPSWPLTPIGTAAICASTVAVSWLRSTGT